MAATASPSFGAKASIGASAVALAASTVIARGVVIKALTANGAGVVYVGNTDAVTTATGFPLYAGDQQTFDVAWFTGFAPSSQANAANLSSIYLIGSTTGLEVRYWFV